MTRVLATAGMLVALTVLASGCGGSKSASASSNEPANITVWTGFVNPELVTFKQVVKDFEKAHPKIHVKVVGGTNDDKIVAAIRGGNAPDVAHSFSSDNTGAFCSSGAWIDLGSYMQKDGIEDTIFPSAPRYYTQFKGKRCALPMLADTYGLYYNKALFAKAGITSPPKTISELTADAKKLTQRNADGSLKVVGFNPFWGWYENAPAHYAPSWGADWVDDKGNSVLGHGDAWSNMLAWQKQLVDWYGYKNLVRFNAGAGDEFSPSNAFETGKVAMNMDGEWRVNFIKKEVPNLSYGTAPFPADDAHQNLYGAGYVTGSIIGIPKSSKHQDQAWQLVKYLGTNTKALALLSNGIQNVPTTTASLQSPDLKPLPGFQTFLDVFGNAHTTTTPITLVGAANQETFGSYTEKYQSGSDTDLEAGLARVDKSIDAQLKNASGGQAP
ncbi:MAG TPA: ABC transporter substrate-binding protein [Gaiellaceae bacterium]|jgi:multiple sugar transport system substrate-binding protein